MKRTLGSILAATIVLTALWGSANSASAAIRVTISDSVNTKVFYSPDSEIGVFATSLGDYDILLQTTLSNFPGQEAGGVLSQTLNVTDRSDPGTGTLPTLTVTADIIGSLGIAGGEVSATDLAAVTGATLSRWTLPSGSSLLVSSDVSSSEPRDQGALGTVQSHTTVNGTVISSLAIPINSTIEAEIIGSATNGPEGYTLTSQLVLSGASEGISGLAIGASSSVRAGPDQADIIPEPGTLAVLSIGAVGLAVTAVRRRLGRQTS
jgi:hypothetical protein